MKEAIDVQLASAQGTADFCLINIGVNDLDSMPTEANFTTNFNYILDAINTKWPYAKCYVMKPWKRNYNTEADTMAGWINTVVAGRSTFTFAGPDERTWLKGADDGVTMTTDGIHYSAAGITECADQWQTILGY